VAEKDSIHFFKEQVQFRLTNADGLKKWIQLAVHKHHKNAGAINFIFCSDVYLLMLNKKYLRHNYFTDIITFDNSTEEKKLEADIYISVDRVRANAAKYKTTFSQELHRVIIHGVLHLLGYDDKSKAKQNSMRSAEEHWLAKRKF
jgi:rRNA maturation RNase YbeY